MKHFRATLALASFMSLGGTAWAGTFDVTFQPGLSVSLPEYGDVRSPSAAYTRMDVAETFIGFLDILNAQVVSVMPAIMALNLDDPSFTVEAPYNSMAAQVDTATGDISIKRVSTSGGLTISMNRLLPSGRTNTGSTGGSISITALKVSPETNSVYADIVGANGVGTLSNILMWNTSSVSGSTSLHPYDCPLTPQTACEGPNLKGFKFNDLTITENAYDVMSQSLGLTTFGKAALASITTYGSISVSSVPEPASVGLMLLGLLGLVAVTGAGRR